MYDRDLARHEAAHFVVDWAIGCPSSKVDITPSAHKLCADGSEIIGVAVGDCGSPFEYILSVLAGPMSDYWEHDDLEILELNKELIARFVSELADGISMDVDACDFDCCLHNLCYYVDVLNPVRLKETLLLFLAAVRSILKSCESEWQEVAKHLEEHGRIGFDGEHWDGGEEAESFFLRWGADWGQPPESIRKYVAQFRAATDELMKKHAPVSGITEGV